MVAEMKTGGNHAAVRCGNTKIQYWGSNRFLFDIFRHFFIHSYLNNQNRNFQLGGQTKTQTKNEYPIDSFQYFSFSLGYDHTFLAAQTSQSQFALVLGNNMNGFYSSFLFENNQIHIFSAIRSIWCGNHVNNSFFFLIWEKMKQKFKKISVLKATMVYVQFLQSQSNIHNTCSSVVSRTHSFLQGKTKPQIKLIFSSLAKMNTVFWELMMIKLSFSKKHSKLCPSLSKKYHQNVTMVHFFSITFLFSL